MDIEDSIHAILFEIGKDIKLHKIDNDNMIIELDYDKYTKELLKVFIEYFKD